MITAQPPKKPTVVLNTEVDTSVTSYVLVDNTTVLGEALNLSDEKTLTPEEKYQQAFLFARDRLSEDLRPERSGISSTELMEGLPSVRARVREIILNQTLPALKKEISQGKLSPLDEQQEHQLIQDLLDHQFGLGPLEKHMREEGTEELIVNSYRRQDGTVALRAFVINRKGKFEIPVHITPDAFLELVLRQIRREGKMLNRGNPLVNAILGNGARLNAVVWPLVDPMLSVTIRVPSLSIASMTAMVDNGTMTKSAASFLALLMRAQMSTIIAGGTGSGKTSILNALSQAINPRARVVCIEDTRELNILVRDVVYIVTGLQNPEAREVKLYTMRDMVANALRQRPDHIIIGEVRDAAAWEAIKATNTGHRGVMMTIHSDEASGVIMRLAQLAREAQEAAGLPDKVLMKNITSGFRFIIYLRRFQDATGRSKRIIHAIYECAGMGETGPIINPIYTYNYSTHTLERTQLRVSEHAYEMFKEMGFSEKFVNDILFQRVDDYYLTVLDEMEQFRKESIALSASPN